MAMDQRRLMRNPGSMRLARSRPDAACWIAYGAVGQSRMSRKRPPVHGMSHIPIAARRGESSFAP
jgi:hypothetical protein